MMLRRTTLAALTALALAATGCSNGATEGPSPSGGGASSATPTPTPTGPAVPAVADALSTATPVSFVAAPEHVTARTPRFAAARNLTEAVEATRGRMLREAWRRDATEVAVDSQVVASSDAVLGVRLHSRAMVAGKAHEQVATLWYSTAKKQTYSSPALVKAAQWPAFATAVTSAVTAEGGDATKAAAALKGMASPWGTGPALVLLDDGSLQVTFSSGAVAAEPLSVTLDARTATPLLGVLGTQAATAAKKPTAFTGATTQPVDAELAKGVVPPRPSTAVGPDCRVLHCASVTYDDGPSGMTPQLLATIKKSATSITFFQMGRSIKEYPDIARKVAAAGMEVGNHSVTHPDLRTVHGEQLRTEVLGNSQALAKILGAPPLLFRPPYGSHDAEVDKIVAEGGMAIMQWEVDTEDWKTKSTSKTIASASSAKDYHATIVLEHDVQEASISAAPQVYANLAKAGMTVVSVTELSLNSGGYKAGHAYCRGTMLAQEGYACKG